MLHEGSPYNLSRAVAYTAQEEEDRCKLEMKVCDLRNTITVTMRPNIVVPNGTTVTVSGLQGAVDIELVSPLPNWMKPGSGIIDASMYAVQFELQDEWNSNVAQVVQFRVTNPNVPQSSPDVSILLKWSQSVCSEESTTSIEIAKKITKVSTPAKLTANYTKEHDHELLGIGDAEVLMVKASEWIIKHVHQSTRDPSEDNTIHVTLAANVELRRGATITLSGLTGFATVDGDLPLTETSALVDSACHRTVVGEMPRSEYRLINPTNDTQALKATSTWKRDQGTLVLTLEQIVPVKSVLEFSFVLKNPCVEQNSVVSVDINDKAFDCDIQCHCPKSDAKSMADGNLFFVELMDPTTFSDD